jgi:hypothetical protein
MTMKHETLTPGLKVGGEGLIQRIFDRGKSPSSVFNYWYRAITKLCYIFR